MVFGLVASSPMLVGFALTRGVTPHMRPISILFLTVLSPIVEEIEFRGGRAEPAAWALSVGFAC